MKTFRTYISSGALLLMMLWLVGPLNAAQDEIVGRALLVVGTVEVIAADGSIRILGRRDAIYEGETIRSASNGRAQIRFTDGARMSIRPDSELSIDDYEFEEAAPPARTRSALSLRRGGFRTATGAVAQRNRSAYRVSTPFAVIGVRGTDWSAAIADIGQGENLFLGVNDGGITAENNAGSIDLGDDGAFNFARIRSFDQMPEGLQALPTRVATTFSADDLPAVDEDAGPEDGAPPAAEADTDAVEDEEAAPAVADGTEEGGDDGDGGPAPAVADGGEAGSGDGESAVAGAPASPDGGVDGGVSAGADEGAPGDIIVDIGGTSGPEGDPGLVFEVTTNCF